MFDFKGQELQIGDKVIYVEGSQLREGYIKKMTEARLHLKYEENYTYTFPDGTKRNVEGKVMKVRYAPNTLYKVA